MFHKIVSIISWIKCRDKVSLLDGFYSFWLEYGGNHSGETERDRPPKECKSDERQIESYAIEWSTNDRLTTVN